ncbi:MAG: 30S ribosomal protein S6 [Bacilli bacterium]
MMFIVKPNIEEANIKEVAENMKQVLISKGATIIDEKALGQRELAYTINTFNTGYYFLLKIESNNADATIEFDRLALINENIIRHLITKVEE